MADDQLIRIKEMADHLTHTHQGQKLRFSKSVEQACLRLHGSAAASFSGTSKLKFILRSK
jgi:hypothetical protein